MMSVEGDRAVTNWTAQTVLTRLDVVITNQQGDARARLIDRDDLIWAIQTAAKRGWARAGGEKVANAYSGKGRAWSSFADAVRDDEQACVWVVVARSYSNSASPLRLSSIRDSWRSETVGAYVQDAIERARAGDVPRGTYERPPARIQVPLALAGLLELGALAQAHDCPIDIVARESALVAQDWLLERHVLQTATMAVVLGGAQ